MKKKFIFILVCLVFLICLKDVFADEISIAEKKRNAIVETAQAYLRRGENFQYDVYRENRFNSPEEATEQHIIYSVCSSFMHQVYTNTLKSINLSYPSVNLIKYASRLYETSSNYYDISVESNAVASGKYILKYYDKNETVKILNDEDLASDWAKFLKKGDVFVVNFGTLNMGHTMIVTEVNNGDVTLINNNGYVYSHTDDGLKTYFDNFESGGSIAELSLVEILEGYRGSAVDEMALIRYITDDNKYLGTAGSELNLFPLSSAAETRLIYPKIDIMKTSKVISKKNNNTSILTSNLGDEIEYTITIKNNSSQDYVGINITENIPLQYVKVISYDGIPVVSDSQLIWKNIDIAKGQLYKITYTVKVNNDKKILGEIINSTGTVGNGTYSIENTNINHYISNTLTTEQKENLLLYKNNLSLYSGMLERAFIDSLYSNILNIDLGLSNLSNNDIISYCDDDCQNDLDGKLLVNNTKINDTSVKNMILYNFYGLATVEDEENYVENQTISAFDAWRYLDSKENLSDIKNRARTITIDMLEVGDIILLYDAVSLEEKDYIYINENELIRKVNENQFEILKNDDLKVFLRNIVGNNYVILRPSLVFSSIEFDENEYLEFDNSLFVDEDKMIVSNINVGMMVDDILNKIKTNGSVNILDKNSSIIEFGRLMTGNKIKIEFINGVVEYSISVSGDVNGDGNIGINDVIQLSKHFLNNNIIVGEEYLLSGDMNNNNQIDINDVIKLSRIIVD